MTEHTVAVGLFGLGEAGAPIAADLARSGADVKACDPAQVATPKGVLRVGEPGEAVAGVDLVMVITSANSSRAVLDHVLADLAPGTVYADLATAAPSLKMELASRAAAAGIPFADVALMAPVPGHGLAVPSLASGSGATRYERMVNALGGRVESVGDQAGRASARKLMRSIVTKGLSALLIESMELAHAHEDAGWLWDHLVAELGSLDEAFMTRLLTGPGQHADRRIEEMTAAADLLTESGLEGPMTRATIERLGMALTGGVPDLPAE